MLDISFDELTRCGTQQVMSSRFGAGEGQGHAVLQLITETVGTTGLIERGTRGDPAGQCLIEQPAIEHDIHGAIGGRDLHRSQLLIPVGGHRRELSIQVGLTIPENECPGVFIAMTLADERGDLDGLAGRQHDAALQGRARIPPGAHGA